MITSTGRVVYSHAQRQPVVAGEARLVAMAAANAPQALSHRELEVLRLVVRGLNNNQIAQALSISRATVKFHVSNLLAKLGAVSRTEAAAMAVERGLLRTEAGASAVPAGSPSWLCPALALLRAPLEAEQVYALTSCREQAREEERARIARELHDELGSALAALKMDVARASTDHPERPDVFRPLLRAVDEAIELMRGIAIALHPPDLEAGDLLPALRVLLSQFAARSGIACRLLATPPAIQLAPPAATALFRALQECLTNVARHAHASHVDATLETRPGQVVLWVSDDGAGFDVTRAAHRPASLGLVGMRERVLAVNGEVSIHSTPGQGTTVRVAVPA